MTSVQARSSSRWRESRPVTQQVGRRGCAANQSNLGSELPPVIRRMINDVLEQEPQPRLIHIAVNAREDDLAFKVLVGQSIKKFIALHMNAAPLLPDFVD